eukprot:TRINITY_DN66919_c5_g1_i2.p2 TRINITY_DN66919_c5_g1~~TRINITY_DN66919_c5_g1_i2.p2  ORF type:complete len:135 (-),score=4.70 TRINITY_DN66919_c5_g1_i2:844-1248(-)
MCSSSFAFFFLRLSGSPTCTPLSTKGLLIFVGNPAARLGLGGCEEEPAPPSSATASFQISPMIADFLFFMFFCHTSIETPVNTNTMETKCIVVNGLGNNRNDNNSVITFRQQPMMIAVTAPNSFIRIRKHCTPT